MKLLQTVGIDILYDLMFSKGFISCNDWN